MLALGLMLIVAGLGCVADGAYASALVAVALGGWFVSAWLRRPPPGVAS